MTNTTNQDSDKVRCKLNDLATWPPKELDAHFSSWPAEEITNLWNLLEQPFRQMCRAFGMATQRQRVSPQGMRTHQQIKRLMVLQRHATGVNN